MLSLGLRAELCLGLCYSVIHVCLSMYLITFLINTLFFSNLSSWTHHQKILIPPLLFLSGHTYFFFLNTRWRSCVAFPSAFCIFLSTPTLSLSCWNKRALGHPVSQCPGQWDSGSQLLPLWLSFWKSNIAVPTVALLTTSPGLCFQHSTETAAPEVRRPFHCQYLTLSISTFSKAIVTECRGCIYFFVPLAMNFFTRVVYLAAQWIYSVFKGIKMTYLNEL